MILPNPLVQLEPGNKVVVFVHHLKEGLSTEQLLEYRHMDDDTLAVAMGMDGYLGHEYASNEAGTVFMSYWRDDESVAEWSRHPLHREAKAKGHAEWYASYRTAICTVERHFCRS
ncbi:MAG: antibiotic biosynthesis monooxygenase [Flavobacteriales bacterium]|nr:antibiotic biosynthesis monooxygenase [Flavobacteriales bacterium]